MKLLFDSTELSYIKENSGHKAGVFYVSLNLLNEFIKQGVEVSFICDFKRYYFMRDVMKEFFPDIELIKEESFLNKSIAKILYLSKNFPVRCRYALLILARFYECAVVWTNKKNINQLHCYDAYFSPFAPPSNEICKSGIKIFRMIHDAIPVIENGMPKSPKDWYYRIYKSINDEDCYFTNSVNTRNDILKYFPFVKESNIKTTMLGANEHFSPSDEPSPVNEKYVFSLCTLGKRKNLEFGIRNFFKFIEKNNIQDLKLVLGGSIWEKYKNELESILNKYDCSKIVMAGYIEENDLAKYYSNALCFIYPSLYEGFGLPVLEAMQCGCPVITSNTSSLPEVIGDCGIQISPKSDEEMISAYEKMYFDSDFRDKCRQKGLDRSKEFSWEKCAGEILEFINNHLGV